MNKVITTRTRTADGQIRYSHSTQAVNIYEGTTIRPFGGEAVSVYRAEHYSYGESRFWDYYGNMIFLSSDTYVEILAHFNV